MFSTEAIKKILTLKEVRSILDIGAGTCEQSRKFLEAGKKVTAIDMVDPPTWQKEYNSFRYIKRFIANFDLSDYSSERYDCVFSSHVVEHILNPQSFIELCVDLCRPGGWVCITFPPLKHNVVGGHVNLFNPGIIMYRLILAGLNCKNAKILQYGYNCTVLVQKEIIHDLDRSKLNYDNGDIETLSKYFPNGHNHQGFDGNIRKLNW